MALNRKKTHFAKTNLRVKYQKLQSIKIQGSPFIKLLRIPLISLVEIHKPVKKYIQENRNFVTKEIRNAIMLQLNNMENFAGPSLEIQGSVRYWPKRTLFEKRAPKFHHPLFYVICIKIKFCIIFAKGGSIRLQRAKKVQIRACFDLHRIQDNKKFKIITPIFGSNVPRNNKIT